LASEAAEIREAIEETRAQLGETVQALAEKADVKAQVTKKVEETKQSARVRAHEVAHGAASVPAKATSNKKIAVPVLVGLLGLALVLLRRHNSRTEGPGTA
jgi:hypothetical protein